MTEKRKDAGNTTIYKVGRAGASFVTTLPPEIRKAFDIEKGDTLFWSINLETGDIELQVFPNVFLPPQQGGARMTRPKHPYDHEHNTLSKKQITTKEVTAILKEMVKKNPAIKKDFVKILKQLKEKQGKEEPAKK